MTEEQIQQIESRFKQYADKHLNPYSIIASDNWSLIHEIRTLQQQQKQLIDDNEQQKKELKRLQGVEQALQDFFQPSGSAQDVFDWLESTTGYRTEGKDEER